MVVDEKKLNEFIEKAVNEWGASMGAMLTFVGDRLGLFKAMAGGALTSEELARKTGTHPRMIREWLAAQAAGGIVTYNHASGTYTLPEEQALALTDENSPAYIAGGYQVLAGLFKDEGKIIEAFKTGKGLGWGDHHHYLFEGTERFFKPNYVANITTNWIPALEGVEDKLRRGGGSKVADVGCGHGASTILMAKAYPNSKIIGFDYHRPSIEWARKEAEKEGLKNITFEVAGSTDYPGDDYDLVAFFDCFHDMGNPVRAAKHVLQTLDKKDGTWMIVEPFANDKIEDNLNPIGRLNYSASTVVCVPASLNENGPALGAQAGEERIREIVTSAGFSKFRRATQTPFNLIFEARP
jgi:SAM-dependent methyltransferase